MLRNEWIGNFKREKTIWKKQFDYEEAAKGNFQSDGALSCHDYGCS